LPPGPDAERLTSLDLVRGVAVLGILPVNIGWFFEPYSWWNPWVPGGETANRPVAILTWFFFEQKFITLFSILFGAGLAIRFDRARARGEPFVGRLLRRQAILLLFGVIHLHLLFYGDVLTTYALIGSVAWLACGLGQKALLGLTVACYGGACAVWCWMWSSPRTVAAVIRPLGQRWELWLRSLLVPGQRWDADAGLVVLHGEEHSLGDLIARRCGDAAEAALSVWLTYGLYVLACFLLGVYLLRSRLFHEPAAHRRGLSRMLIAGLALGIPLNAGFVVAQILEPGAPFLPLFSGIAAPPMSLAYLALLLRWSASGRLPRLRRWLRATGRLAFTNYLSQSLFLNLLFKDIGLGWLTQHFSRLAAFGVIVLIWSFQVAFSAAWLRLFRIGPAEWLWRKLAGDRPSGFVRPRGEPAEAT
jgi:uncharacterized protein